MEWTLDDGLWTAYYKTQTVECELSIKQRQGGWERGERKTIRKAGIGGGDFLKIFY